jgi:hypothetical protein
MYPFLTTGICTFDKNFDMIQPLVKEFWPPPALVVVAKPRIRSDQNLVCEIIWPQGHIRTKFQISRPAQNMPKMAMDNRQRVIVIAHPGELKMASP